MEKIYLVELNIFKENAIYGLQKILLDNFSRNFYIWSAIVVRECNKLRYFDQRMCSEIQFTKPG